ncbi:thermonuclease family protein [Novosphingobium sp. AP12]|uniref:thermonuclease family protein n=1 Tax=Novosphingobium sp. AP12 TaxID=1144305 RepID=UPI0002722464|nr:thermonuclease family protein [Novosphingobium sp. AP12]EJL23522.1 micrococcal nuclease-like nuclease [Novosphingobium sp. AP12]
MIRLAFAAAASFGCFLPQVAHAQDFTGIARAIDGDSLRVGNREVRLFGIDAPEYRQTCKIRYTNWSCGADAATALRSMVDGRQLTCTARDQDVYGRTVATCRASGVDVAGEMLSRGLAITLEHASAEYFQRQAASRTAGAGIWASEFVTPSEYRAANPRSSSAPATSAPPASISRRAAAPATSGMWRSCAQARAAGAAPVHRGEPGYNPMLDGDSDGIACEPYRKRR